MQRSKVSTRRSTPKGKKLHLCIDSRQLTGLVQRRREACACNRTVEVIRKIHNSKSMLRPSDKPQLAHQSRERSMSGTSRAFPTAPTQSRRSALLASRYTKGLQCLPVT